MTIKELLEELEIYNKDLRVVFRVCGEFVPHSITEYSWGKKEVHISAEVKPTHICDVDGKICIELGKE
jgi:hypothetical protein